MCLSRQVQRGKGRTAPLLLTDAQLKVSFRLLI
jgi:hypothetical protein